MTAGDVAEGERVVRRAGHRALQRRGDGHRTSDENQDERTDELSDRRPRNGTSGGAGVETFTCAASRHGAPPSVVVHRSQRSTHQAPTRTRDTVAAASDGPCGRDTVEAG